VARRASALAAARSPARAYPVPHPRLLPPYRLLPRNVMRLKQVLPLKLATCSL